MSTRQQLTDITRGLQHAAQTTLSLVAEQFITMMDQFFDPMPDGSLKAKVVRVELSEDSYTMVPLVSLVTPRGVALEKMVVGLSVRLEAAEAKRGTSLDNAVVDRTSFSVSFAPRAEGGGGRQGDILDVELEFQASPAPEALMRLIDLYTAQVAPQALKPGEELAPMPYVKGEAFQAMLARHQGREAKGEGGGQP